MGSYEMDMLKRQFAATDAPAISVGLAGKVFGADAPALALRDRVSVAVALWRKDTEGERPGWLTWADLEAKTQGFYLEMADAALEALGLRWEA